MKKLLTFFLIIFIMISFPLNAQLKESKPSRAAQSVVTASVLEKNIASSEEISIYVLGNNKIAETLEGYVNQTIGNAKLKSVKSGDALPSSQPDILILGSNKKVAEVKKYCRKNDVLSVTNIPSLVEKGINLGIGVKEGKVKYILNPDAIKEEGTEWKPAIMKVAKTV